MVSHTYRHKGRHTYRSTGYVRVSEDVSEGRICESTGTFTRLLSRKGATRPTTYKINV